MNKKANMGVDSALLVKTRPNASFLDDPSLLPRVPVSRLVAELRTKESAGKSKR